MDAIPETGEPTSHLIHVPDPRSRPVSFPPQAVYRWKNGGGAVRSSGAARVRSARARLCTYGAPSQRLTCRYHHARPERSHEGQQHRMNRRHRLAALAVLCFVHIQRDAGQCAAGDDVPAGPLTLEQVLALAEARSETIGISRARRAARRRRADPRAQRTLSAAIGIGQLRPRAGLRVQRTVRQSNFSNGTDDSGFADLPFGRANTWRVSPHALAEPLHRRPPARAGDVAEAGRDVGHARRVHGARTAALRRRRRRITTPR